MQPSQLAKKAEDAASHLLSLLRSPQVAQLLQRPLPVHPTAAQQAVLASCSSSLLKLFAALPGRPNNESDRAAAIQLLRRVLRHQAVYNAGVLMAWLQQPQQQLAMVLHSCPSEVDPGTVEDLWAAGSKVTARVALLLVSCKAMDGVAELAVDMSQQLLQSGGSHRMRLLLAFDATRRCKAAETSKAMARRAWRNSRVHNMLDWLWDGSWVRYKQGMQLPLSQLGRMRLVVVASIYQPFHYLIFSCGSN